MKGRPHIVALVLAAGYSSRMGSFKPLAPFGDSTVIEEAVTRFIKAQITDVRVVVGHRADELRPVLDRLDIRWIYNADYDRGMFSSVLAGVKTLEAEVNAFFLLPADIPLVKPETIRAILEEFDPDDSKIIYPRFAGQRGHPPLIPKALVGKDLFPDYPGGLRALLGRYEHQSLDLDVIDENILLDCDLPADYQVLTDRRSLEGIPSRAECEAILSRLAISREVTAHSACVAELARMLAFYLNCTGLALDLSLIAAAGLLHDIAKGQPDHAGAGAKLLAEMGFPRVGAAIANHMDIESQGPLIDEADLIYLADKCVEEDRVVSLEERFEKSLRRYGDRPDILNGIMRRIENAKSIAGRIETRLGRPADEIVRRYGSGGQRAFTRDRRTIYLVRHGAIQSPGVPKRFIGQVDLPLNAEGLKQAEDLAENLLNVPLSAVFCSDLKRSADTARIIAKPHGVPFRPVAGLREIALGRWEGLSFDEVRREDPEKFNERGRNIVHCSPPGGESFFDCAFRVIPAFYEILHSSTGDILIVGHSGVNRIILSLALGRPLKNLFEIDQDYGCLNALSYYPPFFEVELQNGSPARLKSF